jgi:hypothetical protein
MNQVVLTQHQQKYFRCRGENPILLDRLNGFNYYIHIIDIGVRLRSYIF